VPFLLELGSDFAEAWIRQPAASAANAAVNNLTIPAITTGAGLLSSILYIVPVVFFYVYYRGIATAAPDQSVHSNSVHSNSVHSNSVHSNAGAESL
jgi:hypothetical protein